MLNNLHQAQHLHVSNYHLHVITATPLPWTGQEGGAGYLIPSKVVTGLLPSNGYLWKPGLTLHLKASVDNKKANRGSNIVAINPQGVGKVGKEFKDLGSLFRESRKSSHMVPNSRPLPRAPRTAWGGGRWLLEQNRHFFFFQHQNLSSQTTAVIQTRFLKVICSQNFSR